MIKITEKKKKTLLLVLYVAVLVWWFGFLLLIPSENQQVGFKGTRYLWSDILLGLCPYIILATALVLLFRKRPKLSIYLFLLIAYCLLGFLFKYLGFIY